MRKGLVAGALALVLAGGSWCLWQGDAPRSPAPDARDAQAPADAAQLGALQRPAPNPRGAHTLHGRVTLNGAPVPAARVRLFVGDVAGGARIDCPCDGQRALDVFALACICDDAEPLMLAAIAAQALAAPVAEVTSDEHGAFTFVELADLSFDLYATHPLGGSGLTQAARPDSAPVSIALSAGHQVRGRVVDELGEPIIEAQVSVVSERGVALQTLGADDAGEFVLSLPLQTHYLAATAPGFLPSFEIVAPGGDEVLLELAAPGVIAGVVTDEDGQPAAGVAVALRGWGTRLTAVTDRDGRFAFADLAPDDYYLVAERDRLIAGKAVVLSPGVDRDDLELILCARQVGTVRGLVEDERGTPLAATVTLIGDLSWGRDRSATDAAGRFTFSPVPPGYYEVVAEAPGYGRVCGAVDLDTDVAGEAEVRFLLPAHNDNDGQVVDHRGQPVAHALVWVEETITDDLELEEEDTLVGEDIEWPSHRIIVAPDDEEVEDDPDEDEELAVDEVDELEPTTEVEHWEFGAADSDCEPLDAVTDAQGRFRLPGLAPGSYTLLVSVADGTPHRQVVALPARGLRIVLPSSARARGLVLDGHGNPAPFTALLLEEAENSLAGAVVSDAYGAFVTPPLFAGNYGLTTALADRLGVGADHRLDFTLSGRDRDGLVVRLPAIVSLEVQVTDRAGRILDGFIVEAVDPSGNPVAEVAALEPEAATEGVVLELLTDREHRLFVTSSGYQPVSVSTAAGATAISIPLDPDLDAVDPDPGSDDPDVPDLGEELDDPAADDVDLWLAR